MNVHKWREFRVGDLVQQIYKAKAYTKEEIDECEFINEWSIPFVSRTESNNSVDFFAVNDNLDGIEKGNAIVIGDTTSTISYQKKIF